MDEQATLGQMIDEAVAGEEGMTDAERRELAAAAKVFAGPVARELALTRELLDAREAVRVDVMLYGVGYLVNGRRVDPREVEVHRPPEKVRPRFVSGSQTSRAAALAKWPRSEQRLLVLRTIDEAVMADPPNGGLTREEVAGLAQLGGDSVRPRVAELIEGGWLEVLRSPEDGSPVTRPTAKGQQAEVLRLSSKAVTRLHADRQLHRPGVG